MNAIAANFSLVQSVASDKEVNFRNYHSICEAE